VLYSNSSGAGSGLIGAWQQGVSFNNVSFTVSPSDSLFKIIAYKPIGNIQPKNKTKINYEINRNKN
jgi:hypothetical protein